LVTHRACQRFLTEASGTNKGGIQCNSFGGSLRASSGHLLSTTLLARPTRFELVTSAFGGQFPRFAVDCGGLRVVDKS
jgi:hypothetical protein